MKKFYGHPEFFKIIERMKEIHSNKSHDYAGKDFDPFANLKLSSKMGIPWWKGCLVRIGDKFSRLCAFARQGECHVKDESIEDTLIDLSNYAIIALILYREWKERERKNDELKRQGQEKNSGGIA
jgi:hypothetical protein